APRSRQASRPVREAETQSARFEGDRDLPPEEQSRLRRIAREVGKALAITMEVDRELAGIAEVETFGSGRRDDRIRPEGAVRARTVRESEIERPIVGDQNDDRKRLRQIGIR